MDSLTEIALKSMIHEQFELLKEEDDVVEEITDILTNGCSKEDSRDEIYSMMIINAMEIAAGISATIIMGILCDSGVVKPVDERRLREGIFSVVK